MMNTPLVSESPPGFITHDVHCGVVKVSFVNFFVSLVFLIFQFFQDLEITFIFDRCRRISAVVIPVKSERNILYVIIIVITLKQEQRRDGQHWVNNFHPKSNANKPSIFLFQCIEFGCYSWLRNSGLNCLDCHNQRNSAVSAELRSLVTQYNQTDGFVFVIDGMCKGPIPLAINHSWHYCILLSSKLKWNDCNTNLQNSATTVVLWHVQNSSCNLITRKLE